MALPPNKTLADLRTALRARLGFGAMGQSSGASNVLLNDILRESQDGLYWEYDFPIIYVNRDVTVGVGQTVVDYPSDIEPLKIKAVSALVSSQWLPLEEGIEFYDDSYVGQRSWPRKFDLRAQLELWPECDTIRTVRIEGYKRLDPFTLDNDRSTLDSDLVLLGAIATAKEHYRQPDADIYAKRLARKTGRLKGASHGTRRYIPGRTSYRHPYPPRPVIV
jgi:hypothetical protein